MDYFFEVLIPTQIVFPRGRDLDQVMVDFEFLGGLPYCSSAIDGTFMKIDKPIQHGDCYRCYKKFTSISILATVDARGLFLNVNAGTPGSAGDAATFHRFAHSNAGWNPGSGCLRLRSSLEGLPFNLTWLVILHLA